MMALVLVCVVLTGMPPTLESRRQKAAERSAEKPWYFSSLTMSMPTDFIIFSPPTLVPRPMTSEQMQHQPDGDLHAAHVALPVAEGEAEEEHADKLLAVLRAVHEAHRRRAGYLRPFEEGLRLPPVGLVEDQRHELAEHPAAAEAQREAEHQAVEHLGPLGEVDAAEAVVYGDGRAGEAGDEAVALARGYAQEARARGVHDDGEERRAQRDERLLEFPPKSTMLLIVKATELLMCVMIKTPRKLKMALIRIAGRTPMQRVLMHVAIALGASVQPLTKYDADGEQRCYKQRRVRGHLLHKMPETYVQLIFTPNRHIMIQEYFKPGGLSIGMLRLGKD